MMKRTDAYDFKAYCERLRGGHAWVNLDDGSRWCERCFTKERIFSEADAALLRAALRGDGDGGRDE